MQDQVLPYILFGILLVIIIGGGVALRVYQSKRAKQRQYRPAVLVKTEREYGEFKDANGAVHKGVTGMRLTFQFKDGSTKTFPVDSKMRGKCSENDWGNLMYEGDKLLKFECKSGAIGTKLYVSRVVMPQNEHGRK